MTIDASWAAAIISIVLAFGAFVGWLTPSPRDKEKMAQDYRDQQEKMAQALRDDAMKMVVGRLSSLENDHRGLEREYIKSNAELRAAVQTLDGSLRAFNVTIQELTRNIGQPNVRPKC